MQNFIGPIIGAVVLIIFTYIISMRTNPADISLSSPLPEKGVPVTVPAVYSKSGWTYNNFVPKFVLFEDELHYRLFSNKKKKFDEITLVSLELSTFSNRILFVWKDGGVSIQFGSVQNAEAVLRFLQKKNVPFSDELKTALDTGTLGKQRA